MHNHYKRVKYEAQRRKRAAETTSAARTSKPLRQDAAAMAADIAAKAAAEGDKDSSKDSSSESESKGGGVAPDRVGFSGRELADVELDKSNVLLLVGFAGLHKATRRRIMAWV